MWSNAKYEVTVNTPFEYYRTMKAEVIPPTTTSPFKANLNVDANKMEMSLNYPGERMTLCCDICLIVHRDGIRIYTEYTCIYSEGTVLFALNFYYYK